MLSARHFVAFVVLLFSFLAGYLVLFRRKDMSERAEEEEEAKEKVREKGMTEIYDSSNIDKEWRRIQACLDFARKSFGTKVSFVVRSPGRVNIIGEHIDYSGYSVLPMAVQKDIVFAVSLRESDSKEEEAVIEICNTDTEFTNARIDTRKLIDADLTGNHWSKYAIAAWLGVKKRCRLQSSRGMCVVVNGTLPKGSGLSSSSALVCGAALCMLRANGITDMSREDIAAMCIECERYVGVDSGGMDQTICMTAKRGFAKMVHFVPTLGVEDVSVPEANCAWVVANSLHQHSLQDNKGTRNYNTRVVECRVAAVLLGKGMSLPEAKHLRTLRDVEESSQLSLPDLLFKCMDLLSDAMSVSDIEEELECRVEEVLSGLNTGRATVQRMRKQGLKLDVQKRALHVYSEAMRVSEFQKACAEEKVSLMGQLMNKSHESCRDSYDCSCDELESLREACLKGGAIGCRLTGAGWGGCLVSLVPRSSLRDFHRTIRRDYYASLASVPLDAVFETSPASGACFVCVPPLDS